MVKIINHGLKPLIRRIGTGVNVHFAPNQEVEVTDERLIEAIKGRKRVGNLQIKDPIGTENVGGGIRTRSRPSKRLSRPNRSKKHLGKSKQTSKKEVKCPKGSYKCKGVCKCDTVKRPKGLRKSKRAD
jgi:hypothetical protein